MGTKEVNLLNAQKPTVEQEDSDEILFQPNSKFQTKAKPDNKPKATNVEYRLNLKTESKKTSSRETVEEGQNIILRFWGKILKFFSKVTKKKEEKQSIEEQPPVVQPSEIEFIFSRDVHIGFLGRHSHVRPSLVKGLSFIPNKLYWFGERGSGFLVSNEPQDFHALRDQCLTDGILFEDIEFPAKDSSIYFNDEKLKDLCNRIEWKRPKDIVNNPEFFVEGYSRFDVKQGALGDCWLLASIAGLTMYRRLFVQIVPDDQSFDQKYAGIFHFRFWQYGRWIDIVVDDFLPTLYGQLIFLHSNEPNEFWAALVEKAYAKLNGSYQAIAGGTGKEAMTDVTGGISERFLLKKVDMGSDFFKVLLKAYERASLMACSINPDTKQLEAQTSVGLIKGHEYTITQVAVVSLSSSSNVYLIRLRNPWGNEHEWNGAWSDGSEEWKSVSEEEQKKLGLTFENDGEFWMSLQDFFKYFDSLEVCNLNPDSLVYHLGEGKCKKWQISMYEGEWVANVTAGGCGNFESYYRNPQYRITLTEADENDKLCTVIIGLMQKHRRGPKGFHALGLFVYQLDDPLTAPIPLDLDYYEYTTRVFAVDTIDEEREISTRIKVPPGVYVIFVTTFAPNEEAQFLLRIFTEKRNIMTEYDNEALSYAPPVSVSKGSKHSDEAFEIFQQISGTDQEVDWMELKEVLDRTLAEETKNRGFSVDICRSMIAMLDVDFSGKLNYIEFKKLWNCISHWKNVFKKFDKDNSGTFSGFELREALQDAGFQLNNRILNKLMLRYGNKKGELNFEDFIMCAIKVKTLIDVFKYKTDEKGQILLQMEEWLETTIAST